MQNLRGFSIFADPAVNPSYGSSEIIFRYLSSGNAGSVYARTAPFDVTVRRIFAAVSKLGASISVGAASWTLRCHSMDEYESEGEKSI